MSHHHHDHEHGEDTYYLDQLCMVALSAAFGAICLAMFFWNTVMLDRLLGKQFHLFVLGSGIVLLFLSVVRGAVLWIQVGKRPAFEPEHNHDHDHAHDHPHDHEHHPPHEHEHCHCSEHHHDQEQSNEEMVVGPIHLHHHVHGDHEHSWAPWRYVMLLIPIVFFLLGLPSKGPQVQAAPAVDLTKDLTKQAEMSAMILATGPSLAQLTLLPVSFRPAHTGKAEEISFKTLEGAASKDELRTYWGGKMVKVTGQFVPDRRTDRVFSLARFRIQCCAADAVQLNVPILADEGISHVRPNDWIMVTGQVDFFKDGNNQRTVLRVHGRDDVVQTTPDLNPYN